MRAPQLLFFRGLNTYGHDHAQLSILKFGPMFRHLAREFAALDVEFHPVLGMGVGPLAEVASRAEHALAAMPAWRDDLPVHFVGHSAGGLVARLLLHRLGSRRCRNGAPKIASVLSIASPHRGSTVADIFVHMPARHPRSALFFRAIGYDVTSKREFFREMTLDSVRASFAGVNEMAAFEARTAAVVCAPPRAAWSRPMRLFHRLRPFREFTAPSDGLVELSSQTFGTEQFAFQLDHFQQAGFFGAGAEFRRMCETIAEYARRPRASSGAPSPGAPP